MKKLLKITTTQEDYLRAIFYLGGKSTAQPSAIARYLNLTKQTVTERLQELAKGAFVNYKKYGSVSLTSEGVKIAQNLTYKHRVCLLYTSPSPRDRTRSRMPSSA